MRIAQGRGDAAVGDDPTDIDLFDSRLAQRPFEPCHVKGGIGDFLYRKIGRPEFVDQRMAPRARLEVALAEKRAQRRRKLSQKPIKADARLVAWIDVLGFSHDLQQVKTDADLQAVYRKMLFVHDWFDKDSVSPPDFRPPDLGLTPTHGRLGKSKRPNRRSDCVARRNSSVTVDTNKFRGDIFPSSDSFPTLVTVLSEVQYIRFPLSCSNQSLPVIPFIAGTDPVKMQLCPTAVYDGK